MKKTITYLICALALTVALSGCGDRGVDVTPKPTPTNDITGTATPKPTIKPSATPSMEPSGSPSPEATTTPSPKRSVRP